MEKVKYKDLRSSFFVRADRLYYKTERATADGYISCGVPLDNPDAIREMYDDEIVIPVNGGKMRKIICELLTKYRD